MGRRGRRARSRCRRSPSRSPAAEIGIDKVVELTRFATPDDEEALLEWAGDVASGAIRRRGEELRRAERVEIEQIEEDRWLAWRWTDEGRRLLLEAEMPAAQGAVVTEALDRLAERDPRDAGRRVAVADRPPPRRRAHGRVRLWATRRRRRDGRDPRAGRDARRRRSERAHRRRRRAPDRRGAADSCATRGCRRWWRRPTDRWSASVAPRGSRRRGCSGSSATATDRARSPDAATRGSRRRTTSGGGHAAESTDLDNLALVCTFHHRLVHEHGWNLERTPTGAVRWLRPDGVRYRAGPRAAPRSLAA